MSSLQIVRGEDGTVKSIVMPRPSNFHAHLRTDALMRATALVSMRWVKHLLVMPNTGPIDTIEKMIEYHRVLSDLAHKLGVSPSLVMTVYLTDKLTPQEVERLARCGITCAVKYYPPHKGATTGSGLGVPLSMASDTLKEMARCGIRLLGHFESVHDRNGVELPMQAREGYFMRHKFRRLRDDHPDLLINIEHASTALAIERVKEDASGKTTCGMTPHHMLISINDLMNKSWRNHGRCMPIPKDFGDMSACWQFGTSGDPRVHLGDDTAPHLARTKEGPFDQAACGCYLPHSLALYALAFESANALDERFVKFACYNGPDSWGLPRPDANDTVRLVADDETDMPDPTPVPEENDVVIPLGWTTAEDRLRIGWSFAE